MGSRKKSKGLKSPKAVKNRRTSLNVNLSYTSNTSISPMNVSNCPSTCQGNIDSIDDSIVKIVPSTCNITVRNSAPWKLSRKKFSTQLHESKTSDNNLVAKEIAAKTEKTIDTKQDKESLTPLDILLPKIKPSFVKLTSIPIISSNGKLFSPVSCTEDILSSDNVKRSRELEDIRFPLQGEIFSPAKSIVMETSMDITEVQGAAILSVEPQISRMPNSHFGVDRDAESSIIIQDTDCSDYIHERVNSTVIADSDEDVTFNTVRTSLNVNTSIDSRFSSIPSKGVYDPDKCSYNRLHDVAANETIGIDTLSESSEEDNIPTNSVMITTAIIEHENSSNTAEYQRTNDEVTVIDLACGRNCDVLQKMSLKNKIQLESSKSNNENSPTDDSVHITRETTNINCNNDKETTGSSRVPSSDVEARVNFRDLTNSSTNTPTSENQESETINPRTTIDKPVIGECIIASDLAGEPVKRRKKKLMKHTSEMVDLSPVATPIVSPKRLVPKKRSNRRNATAKKITNEEDATALKSSVSPEDDVKETDPVSKKKKRVRNVKTKRIVIKKIADIELWNRLNGSTDIRDKSCDEIGPTAVRSSLDDFEPKKMLAHSQNRKKRPKIIIVATGLPVEEKIIVKSTVSMLGSAKMEKIVTRHTTHVVSKGIRTINLLRGILRGCWLVGFEWISKSRDAQSWVDPEPYEITSFAKAVQENRIERQFFGTAYVSELFLTCGLIHIREETSTPALVLAELIRTAGGRVAAKAEEAKIIVGRGGLKEVWIFDSITNGKIQPLEQYYKKKCLGQGT